MNFRVFAEEFFSYLIPGALLIFIAGLALNFSTDISPRWLFDQPWRWVTIGGLILAGYFIGHFAQTLGGRFLRGQDEGEPKEGKLSGREYQRRFFRPENTEVTEDFKLQVLSRFKARHGFVPTGLQSNGREIYRNAHSEVFQMCKAAVLHSDYDHDVRRLDALYGMYSGIYGVLPLTAIVLAAFALKEAVDTVSGLSSVLDGSFNEWLFLAYVILIVVLIWLALPITENRYQLFVNRYIEQVYVDFLEVTCKTKGASETTSMVSLASNDAADELAPKP